MVSDKTNVADRFIDFLPWAWSLKIGSKIEDSHPQSSIFNLRLVSPAGTAHPSSSVYAARAYPNIDRACEQVRCEPSSGGHSPCPVPPRPCAHSWCHDSSRHWRSLWLRECSLANPY